MYRIVATDMDETFLASDHSVPQANVDAILAMRERGVLFVPASGRAYGSIMSSLRDLPAECLEGSYVISYNGGCINRVGQDEPLLSHRISFETVKRLFDFAVDAGEIGMHIYTVDGYVWGWILTDTFPRSSFSWAGRTATSTVSTGRTTETGPSEMSWPSGPLQGTTLLLPFLIVMDSI